MADNLLSHTVLVAYKGYHSEKVKEGVEGRNALTVIPMRRNRAFYILRNMVERCFNKLKNSRRSAIGHDKPPQGSPASWTSPTSGYWSANCQHELVKFTHLPFMTVGPPRNCIGSPASLIFGQKQRGLLRIASHQND